jgi:hypothetical protein
MKRRFELSDIPKFAEKYNAEDDKFVEDIDPIVWGQGYLTREQLFILCKWKSQRRPELAKDNSEDFVKEVTRFALSTADERARIESLRILDGVDYPTASGILHWFHRDEYPVLDFRVVHTLGFPRRKTYTFKFWQRYLDEWRKVLSQARELHPKLTHRAFDRALWQYDKERHIK